MEYIREPATAVVLDVVVKPTENVAVYTEGMRRITMPEPPAPAAFVVTAPPPPPPVLTVPATPAEPGDNLAPAPPPPEPPAGIEFLAAPPPPLEYVTDEPDNADVVPFPPA